MAEKADYKCAIVVSDQLPTGLGANAAAVLSLTLGHRVDGLVGSDVKDATGVIHPGIAYVPVPILKGTQDQVDAIVQAAAAHDDVFFVSFSSLAQGCRTYEEYIDKMSATPTADLNSVGVGLHGPRKPVNKMVGALPLFR
ncbi:Protein of unknown function [Saccharopolyspora shandongensis]|uniref:DUF2000 domain-containing protein n=1 Tax=Saccharopolyspora shandongensis TaxID=418495 RepID=A0A1H2Z3G6_9PSEU|nr:DUF2000 domain-containing protein [Saccharopolyspora shandongensis]SDX11319.1 Protein of unknown function [Saccharopolyspora shandongensis]